MAETDFNPEEKAAIVAEWRRLAAEPLPFNPLEACWKVVIVASVLLLLLAQAWSTLGQPALDRAAQRNTVGGVGFQFFWRMACNDGVYARSYERALESLYWLEISENINNPAERRRHVVTLIYNIMACEPLLVDGRVDLESAMDYLDENFEYGLAVNRALVAEKLSEGIFAKR